MITADEVVAAYAESLRLRVRKMHIEAQSREETGVEAQERLDAICDHDTIELQYLAQETK